MSNESLLHYKKMTLNEESDWAQATVTPGTELLELASEGIVLGQNPGVISPVVIGATGARQRHFTGTYAPAFDINTFLRAKGDSLKILKVAMGTINTTQPDVTSAPNVYQHVLTINEANPYGISKGLTFQAMIASGKIFDILDCVVENLEFNHNTNAEVMFKSNIQSRKINISASTLTSLTYPTIDPFIFHQATFTIGTTKKLQQCNVHIKNNLKMDDYANEQYRQRFVKNGLRDVAGSLIFPIVDSDTYDMYTAWLAGTSAAIVIKWEGATIEGAYKYKVQIDIPKAVYAFTGIPGGGGENAPAGEVPFICLEDTAGGNKEMKITVVNNVATI